MEIAKVSIDKIGLGSAPAFDDYKEVGDKLREAFSKLGFVYISDHGVDEELITRYGKIPSIDVKLLRYYIASTVIKIGMSTSLMSLDTKTDKIKKNILIWAQLCLKPN